MGSEDDELFVRACGFVVAHQQASNNFLQRMLGVGTGRARKLLARMEAAGLIGPADADGRREIFDLGERPQPRGNHMDDDSQTGADAPELNPTDAQEEAEQRSREREDIFNKPHDVRDGSNLVSGQQLLAFVERAEQAMLEKKGKADLLAGIFAEAKGAGYEVVALKNLIKKRAQKPDQRAEQEATEEIYQAAIGMASSPLFAHVAGGSDPVVREARITSLEQQCPMEGDIMIWGPGGLAIWVRKNKEGVTVLPAPDRSRLAALQDDEVTEQTPAPEDESLADLDDAGARKRGMEDRKDNVPIVKNPFAFDDERRRFWDEGWREQDGGSGFGKK